MHIFALLSILCCVSVVAAESDQGVREVNTETVHVWEEKQHDNTAAGIGWVTENKLLAGNETDQSVLCELKVGFSGGGTTLLGRQSLDVQLHFRHLTSKVAPRNQTRRRVRVRRDIITNSTK